MYTELEETARSNLLEEDSEVAIGSTDFTQ